MYSMMMRVPVEEESFVWVKSDWVKAEGRVCSSGKRGGGGGGGDDDDDDDDEAVLAVRDSLSPAG